MRAMQYQGYGDPSRLKLFEIPPPTWGPSQLLVQVFASSVNPVDWKMHNGGMRFVVPLRFPSIPGFDYAGKVVQVGTDVHRFRTGDLVYGMTERPPGNASAEYLVAGENAAALAPGNLTPLEAAALPMAGLTALQGLRDLGRIRAGQRVLVINAAGGVGHCAVQIAKAYGANVTGVTGSRHLDMVEKLGADEIVDYAQGPGFLKSCSYDVIFDAIVRWPVRDLLAALSPGGVCVSVLPSPGRVAAAGLLPLFSKKRSKMLIAKPLGKDLDELRRLCEAGELRPVIDKVFRLPELPEAHRYSQSGRTGGKIVIAVG